MGPSTDRAAVIAADPTDWDGWQAILARLAADGSQHHVVLGLTDDAEAVAAALVAGAGGWLFDPPTAPPQTPPTPPTALPTALPTSADRGARPRWYRATAADGRPIRLSAREIDVLQGIADGMSLSRLARDLGLSTLTVRNHVTRAGRRLGARSRGHIVLLALRSGVIH